MKPEFTAHNIELSGGQHTLPEGTPLLTNNAWFASAKRTLDLVFPGIKTGKKIVDLGCLEGGYATEFARMGFDSLGIEVRQTNFECCEYIKDDLKLPNLNFAHDTVWNLEKYGKFDAVFCCGLLYHLDRPHAFIKLLAQTGADVIILNTHYAPEILSEDNKFNLSDMLSHEDIPGRWYGEYDFPRDDIKALESVRWTSWENSTSFWPTKRALMQVLHNVGFKLIYEQFDWLGKDSIISAPNDYYQSEHRGMFVCVRNR